MSETRHPDWARNMDERVFDAQDKFSQQNQEGNGDHPTHWWPPSWFTALTIAATALGLLGGAVVWYEIADERGENDQRCELAVTAREDSRAMWLELFEVFPDAAAETKLDDDLERLLPPLECDSDGVWHPVTQTDV